MRSRRIQALGACAMVTAAMLVHPGTASAEPDKQPQKGGSQAAIQNPDQALGAGWKQSSDVLVSGDGDTTGFHVYVAREKDAFQWSTLATLNAGLADAGAWTGNICMTGSGRYAAVVYAPTMAANRPAFAQGGAFAAMIDTQTGKVTAVPERVQLAHFNPACGPDDRVLLTRSVGGDDQQTDVISVAAATGRVDGTRRIKAQLTSPAPAPDGDYGVVSGSLVKIGRSGQLTKIGTPGGQPYAARATAAGEIDLLTVQRDAAARGRQPVERAVAYRFKGGKASRLGDAPHTRLDLFGLAGGRNALVGDVSRIAVDKVPHLTKLSSSRPARAMSVHGNLLVSEMLDENRGVRAGAPTDPKDVQSLRVTVEATKTGQLTSGTVATARKAAGDVPVVRSPAKAPAAPVPAKPYGERKAEAPSPSVGPFGKGQSRAAAAAEPDIPAELGFPGCAVSRNHLFRQVLQPSANQIEWAVDQAVNGTLMVQRPQNYLKAGEPAYRPQQMFPLPKGSPKVPAQLMLAILAQETNLYQGSWHGVPGDAVNPLISDYYGNREDPEGKIEHINYKKADCGYGVAQVTDGMQLGATKFTSAQRTAIALDYAANIAAGLQILVEKYKQLRATDTWTNSDDPQYIENWFLAVWGYNSGVYPKNGSKPYGVGWFNNPANPRYPANRGVFLRDSKDHAAVPFKWSYPEKIMGWAEVPQWQWIEPYTKYAAPQFGAGAGGKLTLPDRYQFCGPVNNCSRVNEANPCPANSDACWWHGTTSWATNSQQQLATEKLAYPQGSAEPALIRTYPTACTPLRGPSGTLIVDDLADSSQNLLCPGQPWGGKMTLRNGSPSGTVWSDYAAVDLHQISGYLGHAWFTHAYDPDSRPYPSSGTLTGTRQNYHQIVGTWTPNITNSKGAIYTIVAHLPSHGANVTNAKYLIRPNDPTNSLYSCTIDQDRMTAGKDVWVSLGNYWMGVGSRVQLSNMIDDASGEVDIAYDAIAFVPANGDRECGDRY